MKTGRPRSQAGSATAAARAAAAAGGAATEAPSAAPAWARAGAPRPPHAAAAAAAARAGRGDAARAGRLQVFFPPRDERHHGAVREVVVAMLRHLHVYPLVGHLRSDEVAAERVQEVPCDPRIVSGMPPQCQGDEGLEVGAGLRLQRCLVLCPVLCVRAMCHLTVGEPRLSVVVEENAVELAEIGQARLPRPIDDHDVRALRGPGSQSHQHGLRALDDDVLLWIVLLDGSGAVAAAEADLQHAAALVDVQRLDAALHVRLLPLHHHLCAVHVQELLLAIPVQGEEEAVCPILELRPSSRVDARPRPRVPSSNDALEGFVVPAAAFAHDPLVLLAVGRVRAPLHLAPGQVFGAVVIQEDAVEGAQGREALLPRSLHDLNAGLACCPQL
mmetsp:Transcript_9011/g.23329  ORF Transcript_9011/g.23329 Transcript_9011/m.23329 type:complete len:387 (-) Transcript_9011:371-1531(-)